MGRKKKELPLLDHALTWERQLQKPSPVFLIGCIEQWALRKQTRLSVHQKLADRLSLYCTTLGL